MTWVPAALNLVAASSMYLVKKIRTDHPDYFGNRFRMRFIQPVSVPYFHQVKSGDRFADQTHLKKV